MQHLEKQVAEAAEVVRDWKNTIAKIETEFNVANLARENAKKTREAHALKAAMGNAHAVSEIKHARAAQTAAEQTIADLAVALPAAEAQLANAEKSAELARHELARFQAEKIMRSRVAAAQRMDTAFAEVAAAYELYQRLGLEIQSYPDLNLTQGGMARWEEVTGEKRISAAVPICLTKLPAWTWTHPAKRVPLAESEAGFWSLSPEQPAKAA
jgi:hypothetical protein